MYDDDVSSDEMRWIRPDRDEIDAVMADDLLDDDLADVAALVHDLRSAYLADEPLTRHPALAAFTDTALDHPALEATGSTAALTQTWGMNRDDSAKGWTGRKNKMMGALSAFVAGVTAKVVLGTAVAAASVGGLHAANVVDVPGLPDQATEQQVATTGDVDAENEGDPADEASHGQETSEAAKAKREQAAAFRAAKQEWSDCVDEASAAHDASGATGPFDRVAACGEKPHPRDFGVTDPPGNPDHGGKPDHADRRGPEGTPGEDKGPKDPTDKGTNPPASADSTDKGTKPPAPTDSTDSTDKGTKPPAPDSTDPTDLDPNDLDPTDKGTNPPVGGSTTGGAPENPGGGPPDRP